MFNCRLIVWCFSIVTLLGVLLIPVSAQADPPPYRYRVTDLGYLGDDFTPNVSTMGSFGINELGQVVFAKRFQSGQEIHAAVCFPEPAYGKPAGVYDLTGFTLENEAQPSIARDINSAGLIVGQVGGIEQEFGSEAVVWELREDLEIAPANLFQLGVIDGAEWSRGNAISDSVPAYVVGDSEYLGKCYRLPCDQPWDGLFTRAFQVDVSAEHFILDILQARDCSCLFSSHARDVVMDAEETFWINGFVSADTKEACPGFPDGPYSRGSYLYTHLQAQAHTGIRTDRHSEGRGIGYVESSDDIVSVGFARENGSYVKQAFFWRGTTIPTEYFVLGDVMPTGHEGNESEAEAINNGNSETGQLQVVGWDDDTDQALLWEETASGWTVTDLNAEGIIRDYWREIGGDEYFLWQALDINNDGWIVGWGDGEFDTETPPTLEPHAFLLTPVPECYHDLTGDSLVDINDIFAAQGQWGECEIGVLCSADVTFDGLVNIDDIFAILAAWGPCPGSKGSGNSNSSGNWFNEWMNTGGLTALETGRVTWEQVEQCLDYEDREITKQCLNSLLTQ